MLPQEMVNTSSHLQQTVIVPTCSYLQNLQLFAKFAAICKILTKNRDSCVNKNLPQCFCFKCLKKVPNIATLLDMLVKKNKYKWFLLG